MITEPVGGPSLVALDHALAALSPTVRAVYLLSTRDGLPLDRNGARLGMDRTEVTEALAVALGEIDRVVPAE
jgi:DNA-directed RNA polymerase specialized sigma24 family protein